MLVIHDTISDIPDIIIVQIIIFECLSVPSAHLTCVPILSVVAVKLNLVFSPELLLKKAAVNPVLLLLLICPEVVIVAIRSSYDGEYQAVILPFIVQVTAPRVCGHTP